MKKIRIGNDFKFIWAINWNGEPEDFSNATDIKLTAIVYNNKVELTLGEDFEISGNLIKIDFTPNILTCTGVYNVELKYTKPADGFIDGERRSAIDVNAFQIVGTSEEADTEGDVATTSEALTGFQGLSAYEVWLKDNPGGTKEDYYDWLRQPATDIAETVNLQEQARVEAEEQRVLAEQDRQTNTATAISNAETATENANTAALNADNARLAIQDDLALKANHGYGEGETPKTLKEVDDSLLQLESDVEQLAYAKIKNEVVNGNFENGLIYPFSRNDGYGGASTLVINNSTPISGNYDLRFTIITPATSAGRPILNGMHKSANVGDKIYLHFYAKILSGTPRILSIQNGSVGSEIYRGDVVDGRNTRVINVNGTSGTLGLIYFDSRSVWDMQMDNFMRINLTETFGAGNEPTEEEMNLLLDIAGISYIDDEAIIPAQKIMQWELVLIRKNKNAIIALGGTII